MFGFKKKKKIIRGEDEISMAEMQQYTSSIPKDRFFVNLFSEKLSVSSIKQSLIDVSNLNDNFIEKLISFKHVLSYEIMLKEVKVVAFIEIEKDIHKLLSKIDNNEINEDEARVELKTIISLL